MLRITIELVPHGDESKKKLLHQFDAGLQIGTDKENKRSPNYGNYVVYSLDEYGNKEPFDVKNHSRFCYDGAAELARKVIVAFLRKAKKHREFHQTKLFDPAA